MFTPCMDVKINFVKNQGCGNQHLVSFDLLVIDDLTNMEQRGLEELMET